MTQITKCTTGILFFLLFQGTGELRGEASSSSYKVKLGWNASSSTNVTDYRIHFGTVSGGYTASIMVENVTTGTVSGLAEGVTYYFSVCALNGSGLESGFSNEVSFKPGLHASGIRIAEDGQPVLTVSGLIGSQYDIEASEDLMVWAIIETVTMPDGGSLKFSDPDAGFYPRRFYRTRQRP